MYRIMLADDEGIMLEALRNIIESNFGDECDAVAPVTATTPGLSGQLALQPGGFHIRAYPGQAAFPPPGARPPIAGNSGSPR